MDVYESEQGDQTALTIHDFIELPNGTRQPYYACPEDFNLVLRAECEDLGPRLDDLKECEGQIEAEDRQSQTVAENGEKPSSRVSYGTAPEGGSTTEIVARTATLSVESGSFPLPQGKLYHVFFSHCNEDRDWVNQLVERLESPEYGFKCCFADRDFDIGVPVFQNITKCIHSSKRTVIVMSPEFLESPWCSYETRITLELDLDTRQRLLIPVMLRPCQIPEYIGRLSYLDAENEHFWDRFLAALKDNEPYSTRVEENIGSSAIMACDPFQFNPNFYNTEKIAETVVYNDMFCCIAAETEFMPDELLHRGLQLTQIEYRDIVVALTGSCYVKRRGSRPMAIIQVLLIAFLILITIIYLSIDVNIFRILLLIYWAITLLLLAAMNAYLLKAVGSIQHAVEAANTIARTRNLMVYIKDTACCECACSELVIVFSYYDWRPCVTHLRQFLLEFSDNTVEATPRGLDENAPLLGSTEHRSVETENEALNLLIKHATEYCQLLVDRKLLHPREQRHTRQGECLCQFVESIMLSGKRSCLDYFFGVTHRKPWRRYWFT